MRAVLDANVLFPFTLRDTLLRAAAESCFQVYWSERILDEATRNLVETRVMTARQSERLRAIIREQGADLRRPPMAVEDLLGRLERVAPKFVTLVRAKLGRVAR